VDTSLISSSTLKMEATWPPKHLFPANTLHGAITQKTTILFIESDKFVNSLRNARLLVKINIVTL